MKIVYGMFMVLLLAMWQCKPLEEKNISDSDNKENATTGSDTTSTANQQANALVAGVPLYFDSVGVLMHPVGLTNAMRPDDQSRSKLNLFDSDSYSYTDNYFWCSSNGYDSYSGRMSNIVFETDTTHIALTGKRVVISEFTFLRELKERNVGSYIIYLLVQATDITKAKTDKPLLTELWMSKTNGTEFTQISPLQESFEEGKLIATKGRYYFRTKVSAELPSFKYYYIQFNAKGYEVEEYQPLQYLNK